MDQYYTFEYPIDRGPNAWARYATETQQLGPYNTYAEAWAGFTATHSEQLAKLAWIIRVD